jgi:hypothetical protein
MRIKVKTTQISRYATSLGNIFIPVLGASNNIMLHAKAISGVSITARKDDARSRVPFITGKHRKQQKYTQAYD